MLSHLVDSISHIFREDYTSPQHENLKVSVYCHSACDSTFYSTTSGDHLANPFAGTRPGIFAVIQSSLMGRAPQWPAMAVIPIVPCIRESLWDLYRTNLVLCMAEDALVVWATSIDDILSICTKVRNEIAHAKFASSVIGSKSSSPFKSWCVPTQQEIGSVAWSVDPSLDRLDGLGGVEEPFVRGLMHPRFGDHTIVVCSSDPIDQEPELDYEPSDPSIAMTFTPSLLSPMSLSPALSVSSRSSSTPPLSPNLLQGSFSGRCKYEADGLPSASYLHLPEAQNGPQSTWTAGTVSLREINFDYHMETTGDDEMEEADECGEDGSAYPEPVPSVNTESPAIPPTPEQLPDARLPEPSPVKIHRQSRSKTIAIQTCPAQRATRSSHRSRHGSIISRPYPTTAKPPPAQRRPSLSPSLLSKANTPAIIDEDYLSDADDSDDHCETPRKARRHQKRKKPTKKRFRCKFCSESFTREADAERHLKSCPVNPAREEKRLCDYCGKGLPVRDDAKDRHWKSRSCTTAARQNGIDPGSSEFSS